MSGVAQEQAGAELGGEFGAVVLVVQFVEGSVFGDLVQ